MKCSICNKDLDNEYDEYNEGTYASYKLTNLNIVGVENEVAICEDCYEKPENQKIITKLLQAEKIGSSIKNNYNKLKAIYKLLNDYGVKEL